MQVADSWGLHFAKNGKQSGCATSASLLTSHATASHSKCGCTCSVDLLVNLPEPFEEHGHLVLDLACVLHVAVNAAEEELHDVQKLLARRRHEQLRRQRMIV